MGNTVEGIEGSEEADRLYICNERLRLFIQNEMNSSTGILLSDNQCILLLTKKNSRLAEELALFENSDYFVIGKMVVDAPKTPGGVFRLLRSLWKFRKAARRANLPEFC